MSTPKSLDTQPTNKKRERLDERIRLCSNAKKEEMSYNKDEVEFIDEGPLESIVVLVVDLGGCALFDEDVLDEAVDGRGLYGAVGL